MILREACELDLCEIARIEEESILGEPWKERDFKSCYDNKNALLMVAESDGSVAGYAAFYVASDEAELPTIAVAKQFRGQGVAKLLMTESMVIIKAAGVKELFLEVRESNEPAKALYKSLGFEEIGKRKAFYIDPVEDALMMKKCL